MTQPIIGTGIKVELQKTLGAAATPTGATKANPAVVTLAAHGLANGDVVIFTATEGMIELDGRAGIVANKTNDTFEVADCDSSGYSTFVAAGLTYKKVTAWETADVITKWDLKEGSPVKIDSTTIHDTAQKQVFGMDPPLEGSMSFQSAPKAAFVKLMRGYAKSKSAAAQRVTFPDGTVIVTNSYISGGRGIGVSVNTKSESEASFTLINDASYV